MLFMVTQIHTPETCPIDAGGSDVLFDQDAEGVTLKGRWGAWAHHTIWYLLEADTPDAILSFLKPGFKRCTSTVEPVGEESVQR